MYRLSRVLLRGLALRAADRWLSVAAFSRALLGAAVEPAPAPPAEPPSSLPWGAKATAPPAPPAAPPSDLPWTQFGQKPAAPPAEGGLPWNKPNRDD